MFHTRHAASQGHAVRLFRTACTPPLAVVAALLLSAGAVGLAQKVVNVDEFDRAMKTIGAAFEGVKQATASKSYAEAKIPLALSRQVLASSRPFWEASQRSDVAKMTRAAVARLDALDKALSAKNVDPSAVTAALDEVTRACDACHATEREGNPQVGYRIKSASP